MDAIAFTWLVYQITGSAAWSALVFGLNQLPSIFVQPLAGPFVEGKNKKHIIMVTDILRGLIIAAFVTLYYKKLITLVLMAAFTLLITTVESEVYGMDSNFMSVCTMLMSGATIIASLMMPKIIDRFSFDTLAISRGSVLGLTSIVLSLGSYVKGNVPLAYLMGGVCFLSYGLFAGLLSSCLNVTFVKSVDQDYLARIGAVFNAIAVASTPIATCIVGVLAVSFSVARILFVFGVIGTLSFVGIFFFWNSKIPSGVVENET